MLCHSCGEDIKLVGGVSRSDTCPKCDADMHCCLNCNFYDRTKSNQCAEPGAEWTPNKSDANFCEYFEPATKGRVASAAVPREQVRNAFDALFKK